MVDFWLILGWMDGWMDVMDGWMDEWVGWIRFLPFSTGGDRGQ